MKSRMFIALAVAGTVLGVAGCNREQTAQPTSFNTPAPAPVDPAAAPPASQPGANEYTRTGSSANSPAVVREEPARTVVREPRRTAAVRDDGPTYVEKRRSKKKSAAIIGGSAATGAAIGALAGGGKGAAIGAIAGGAGGLVYDRATAKKKERID